MEYGTVWNSIMEQYGQYGSMRAKRLELLRELVPEAALVGLLTNPKSP